MRSREKSLPGSNGAHGTLPANARDIQVRLEEERIRLLYDSITDCGITMLDEDGFVQSWHPGAQRLHGHEAVEIIGKHFSIFFLQDDLEAREPERILHDAEVFGRAESSGWRIRKDGTSIWLEIVTTPVRDASGALIGFARIERDLTERKKTGDAIKENESRLRAILDTVPDAIIVIDEAGLIESFSPAATRLFGYSLDQVVGKNVKMLMPASCRDHHDDYIARYRETGEKRVIGTGRLVTGQRQDGTQFPMELAVAEARGGRRRLFTGFVRDMTERHRAEAELQEAKAAAEHANRAKSDFLSSMSHELRTPLNAILGFAQLLQSGAPTPTPDQSSSIDQILQAGWYLLTLINEILDLSLIESGKLTLSPEPVSVGEVLSHCQSMMEPLSIKRGISMTIPQFEKPCFVMADRTRLQQVLVNLLSNANKYNRQNGTITISCEPVSPGQVRISVTDTGMGLSPENLRQLYQPFNRLGQDAGTEQGTGIGLVVTKRLVEAMGGTIGVESEVGVGTTFWIDLDSADSAFISHAEPQIAKFAVPQSSDANSARTLLYVEDNPANLKLIEMVIARRKDLKLLSAGSGDLGIELARAHRPDVILMDINLPGINGLKALAALQIDAATAHIPVIAVSANASPKDIARGLDAGFVRYLTKPIRIDELIAALNFALEANPHANIVGAN